MLDDSESILFAVTVHAFQHHPLVFLSSLLFQGLDDLNPHDSGLCCNTTAEWSVLAGAAAITTGTPKRLAPFFLLAQKLALPLPPLPDWTVILSLSTNLAGFLSLHVAKSVLAGVVG